VATQDDVRRLALALPEVVEATDRFAFSVRNGAKEKGFCWAWNERVEPKMPRVPNPGVLAVSVADLETKDILLGSDPDTFFTEPHYNGFPAVLVRLEVVDLEELGELLIEAWCVMAPRKLVRELEERLSRDGPERP
jgi:hypothetical protein